jgi:FixJ family two-component response regulator
MPKVLLVDDEPSIRLTMGEFLKRAGYSVLTAADYNSAVVHEVEDLDVAVIDFNLPGKNGIQLLQKIRDAEIYVPVIMITGEPNLSVIPEIVRAGAYDFIAKPIVKDVLLNAVGRAAEKKRLIDEKRLLEEEIRRHTEELEMRVAERTAELVETHKRLVTAGAHRRTRTRCGAGRSRGEEPARGTAALLASSQEQGRQLLRKRDFPRRQNRRHHQPSEQSRRADPWVCAAGQPHASSRKPEPR